MADASKPLLDVDDLEKYFPVRSGIIKRTSDYVGAVDGISFDVERGETLALVGESGSGRSTVARTITGLISATGGAVRFDGEDITNTANEQLAHLRSCVRMVFQDPTSSLNPWWAIGKSLAAPLKTRDVAMSDLRECVIDLLERAELNSGYWNKYPHELSDGQEQRVNVARAFAVESGLPSLDKPTNALDVGMQAKTIAFFEDLQAEFGLTYPFITHDLSLVYNFADETAMTYLGEIQEHSPTQEVSQRPRHPYSRVLLSAIPVTTGEKEAYKPRHEPLRGEIPSPRDILTGRRSHTRCPYVTDACPADGPTFVVVDTGPSVRCHTCDETYADAFDGVPEMAVTAVVGKGAASSQEPRRQPQTTPTISLPAWPPSGRAAGATPASGS